MASGIGQRLQRYGARHLQMLFGALGRLCRQPLASLMTVAVIGIALALPAALYVAINNAKALGGRWDSVADLSVYTQLDVSEEAAASLAERLRSRADVTDVTLVTRSAALDEFRRLSGFGDAIEALEDNPLPHVLVVRPADSAASGAGLEALADALSALEETDLVQLDTEWVQRFYAILDVVRRAAVIAALLLAVAVIVIVGNTIRLDIQNRRSEIEITMLIGASRAFIRRPFLYSGLWYGIGGGLVAALLIQTTLGLLSEPVGRIAGLYGSDFRLASAGVAGTAALIGGGAALGWLGSWIAAARHMRAIEPQ
ncbi:MAG: permease-like cell division protein FtsX [Pseudomonadota bacterium]